MKRTAVAILIVVALAGCGSSSQVESSPAATTSPTQSPTATVTILEMAAGRCGLSPLHGATIGDAGRTLTIDGLGEEDADGVDIDGIRCLLDVTEASDAVRSEIQQTRALDGRQQGTWGDIEASWAYHPDSGIEMVLTLKS